MNYENMVIGLKALSDPNRLKIVDLLSSGTKCACDILKYFDFSQPALSHHMKILERSGIITVHKQSTWNYYALSKEFTKDFQKSCQLLFSNQNGIYSCIE